MADLGLHQLLLSALLCSPPRGGLGTTATSSVTRECAQEGRGTGSRGPRKAVRRAGAPVGGRPRRGGRKASQARGFQGTARACRARRRPAVLGRSRLRRPQQRAGALRPALPEPAPSSILPASGSGGDAALRPQVRSGAPHPLLPSAAPGSVPEVTGRRRAARVASGDPGGAGAGSCEIATS